MALSFCLLLVNRSIEGVVEKEAMTYDILGVIPMQGLAKKCCEETFFNDDDFKPERNTIKKVGGSKDQ